MTSHNPTTTERRNSAELVTAYAGASEATNIQQLLAKLGPPLPLGAVLATLPYTLIYLLNLWSLPHYQFFPLLLVGTAVLGYQRWGTTHQGHWSLRVLRLGLLATGVGGTVCATLFASPWMGFFGFVFCLAAWLGYRRDAETRGSLMYLALPMLLIWQPPYNTVLTADSILIQSLQSVSAKLSSQWLDISGYAHHQPGTILEFAGRSFGVAEACSGIQSLFAVLCFGALLIVYLRRPPLHALLLLATCPCWALLMNTIRITAIPIAHALFGLDLSHGVLHDVLGYCTMGLAILLLISSDELLLKVGEFLPRWLRLLGSEYIRSDAKPRHSETAKSSEPKLGELKLDTATNTQGDSIRLAWPRALVLAPALLLFAFCFGIQAYDASESWGKQRHVIDFFRDEPLIELAAGDAPQQCAGWKQTKYAQEIRARGNDDLGERSDLWFYSTTFGLATVSFDQMFPGWHELTRCYRNAGWTPDKRTVIEAQDADGWPIVIVEMTRNNEYGYLVFSLVDRSGKPLQPPGEYSYWTILQERIRARLTPAVRGALFSTVAYQMQAFVSSYAPLPDAAQAEVLDQFKTMRKLLWETAQARQEL
ncbi:MAG: exosortase U [Aureliella sp.]